MALTDILYLVLIVSVVIITITLVWVANELMGLIKSLRKSASDTETMTSELKDKVLLVSEALDRAGTAATKIIGMIEDGIESIKEKRNQITNSIGLVAGMGDFVRQKKQAREDAEEESKSADADKSDESETKDDKKPEDKK
jgi:Sec-independent protein translocase protein TatA